MDENLRLPIDLVVDYLVRAEVESLDHPFIVVCRDPSTGSVSYSGPYHSGLAALQAAEREHRAELRAAAGEPGSLEFSVAPLAPGPDLHQASA